MLIDSRPPHFVQPAAYSTAMVAFTYLLTSAGLFVNAAAPWHCTDQDAPTTGPWSKNMFILTV